MAQASAEVVKMQEQSELEVGFTEFIANKEAKFEKASFGKKLSRLINMNLKETRTIQDVKNTQNFRLYAIF